MSLLLMRPAAKAPKLRGRKGVITIVRLVPPSEKHDLAWWQAWLAEHWDG